MTVWSDRFPSKSGLRQDLYGTQIGERVTRLYTKTWLPGKHQVFSLRSAFGFSSDAFDPPKQSQRLQGAAVPCTQSRGHVRQRLLTPADSEPDHRHGQ